MTKVKKKKKKKQPKKSEKNKLSKMFIEKIRSDLMCLFFYYKGMGEKRCYWRLLSFYGMACVYHNSIPSCWEHAKSYRNFAQSLLARADTQRHTDTCKFG